MKPYRLTLVADNDIIKIAAYGIKRFGVVQAERYQQELERIFRLICDFPRMGRTLEHHPERRRFYHGRHVIIYSTDKDGILIERILHGAMDIDRHL